MSEPGKKDDALAAAVRAAFQKHMENARRASPPIPPPRPAAQPAAPSPPMSPPVVAPSPAAAAAPVAAATARPEPKPEPRIEPAAAVAPPVKAEAAVVAKPEPPRPAAARDLDAPRPTPAPAAATPPRPAPAKAPVVADDDAIYLEQPRRAATSVARGRAAATPRAQPVILPTEPPESRSGERQLVPPEPANDGEARLRAAQERIAAATAERQKRLQRLAERSLAPPEPPAEAAREPAPETKPSPRRGEAANANHGGVFGTGAQAQRSGPSSSLWAVAAAFLVVAVLCGAAGGYIWWMNGRKPNPEVAVVPIPERLPQEQPAVAALSPAAPAAETETPVVSEHAVRTATISLNAVDVALQDARELSAMGDFAGAREVLEPHRASGDPRVLFALAETYDPLVNRTPSQADAKQAQALYEAAGKAGFQGAADRLAKLQTPAN